jgi:hypothetical protein
MYKKLGKEKSKNTLIDYFAGKTHGNLTFGK